MDDKSQICIPFILERLALHRQQHTRPFFIGLNGIQGAGKTTLVTALQGQLAAPPHSLRTQSVSIDDLYLKHADQRALATAHPNNPLLQHRGQPGTHDLPLATSLFTALRERKQHISIPSYDKSANNGQGERVRESDWAVVNTDTHNTVDVVLFEGWCVGFRPLSDADLESKWRASVRDAQREDSQDLDDTGRERAKGKLGMRSLGDVKAVNGALKGYDPLTDQLDAFIHIDADDVDCVYEWRLEQERGLRKLKGKGMTDGQVIQFVNGYYPAYELFSDRLRRGIFPSQNGKHLRLVVGGDRRVLHSEVL